MKITIFTSNSIRHNYLCSFLSKYASELFIIQEVDTRFIGLKEGEYQKSKIVHNYFNKVEKAQKSLFPQNYMSIKNKKKVSIMNIKMGDLNYLKIKDIKDFLNSDVYIVFGSSYIKGELINFLIKEKAINIHMGVSPYYRGTDCNFWALYDRNAHLVGATVHYITKKLDEGPVLWHAITDYHPNYFLYTMASVKAAFASLKRIFLKSPLSKNNNQTLPSEDLIRYSKKIDFSEEAINKFYKKKIIFTKKNLSLFTYPFILKKKYFFRDL